MTPPTAKAIHEAVGIQLMLAKAVSTMPATKRPPIMKAQQKTVGRKSR